MCGQCFVRELSLHLGAGREKRDFINFYSAGTVAYMCKPVAVYLK